MASSPRNQSSASSHTPSSYVILICTLAALFYLYEFVVRVMPSVMAHELMHSLHIGAAQYGLLSALFFYGYIPLQIPAGLVFDRWGARNILALMTLICALANLGFALTHSYALALAMRWLMGFSGAFAFTGAAFTASRWIAARYFAFYTGLIQTLGCVGAILGQAPLAYLKHQVGWRHSCILTSYAGIACALLIYLIVRDKPSSSHNHTASENTVRQHTRTMQRLRQVLGNRQNWWVGLYAGLSWASINLFASLWGIPFLMKYYNISSVTAGGMLASCWIGVAVGSPLIGWWAENCQDRIYAMLTCIACGLLSSLMILYGPGLSITSMLALLFVFGLSAGGQPISFDLVYANNKASTIGTAIGFNNMWVIAGGLVLQPLAGWILQQQHAASWRHLLHQHQLSDYRHAMLIMPICLLINIGVVVWGIKKELRQRHSQN